MLTEIQDTVAANLPGALPRYARLMEAQGGEVPRMTIGFGDLLGDLTPDHHMILATLFTKGALTEARKEISGWTDAAQRTSGFAALALAFAMAGETKQALAVLDLPELANPETLGYEVRFVLVKAWARTGNAAKASLLPEVLGAEPDWFPHLRVAIIAALVAGDADTAWRPLSMIEPHD